MVGGLLCWQELASRNLDIHLLIILLKSPVVERVHIRSERNIFRATLCATAFSG